MTPNKFSSEHNYELNGYEFTIKHMVIPTRFAICDKLEKFIVHKERSSYGIISFTKRDFEVEINDLVRSMEEINRLCQTIYDGEGLEYMYELKESLNDQFNDQFNHEDSNWKDVVEIVKAHFVHIGCTSKKHPLFWAKELFEQKLLESEKGS